MIIRQAASSSSLFSAIERSAAVIITRAAARLAHKIECCIMYQPCRSPYPVRMPNVVNFGMRREKKNEIKRIDKQTENIQSSARPAAIL